LFFIYGILGTMKKKTMCVYLVGGAVRDGVLHLPFHERDWVVVGGTSEVLLSQGYQQVGRDFPVFLHPKSKEEYALARTERKTGAGYHGFACDASPDVTLDEDLLRRDLTINAMAMDKAGQIIDPYGGMQDIQAKKLRHVSSAFVEDPVRVLRIARFAARFHRLGFRVAEETDALIKIMVAQGELTHLVPERVWQEWHKSLGEQNPEVFIHVLQATDALGQIFPEFESYIIPMVEYLKDVSRNIDDALVRFAAFMRGLEDKTRVEAVCGRLRVPNDYRQLAVLAVMFDAKLTMQDNAEEMVWVLERTDAFRKRERFLALLSACEVGTIEHTRWLEALDVCQAVDVGALVREGHRGAEIKRALHQHRVDAVKACLT
jgi:tRNA nucleotidyltransferase (CCA-adding enzyme)